jgi:hypothetical protein
LGGWERAQGRRLDWDFPFYYFGFFQPEILIYFFNKTLPFSNPIVLSLAIKIYIFAQYQDDRSSRQIEPENSFYRI